MIVHTITNRQWNILNLDAFSTNKKLSRYILDKYHGVFKRGYNNSPGTIVFKHNQDLTLFLLSI